MDKLLYLISEGVKNVWRHKMTTFTAVFSLFLALFFVGVLAIAGDNTHSVLQYLRSKYKIEVFFNQDVGHETAKGIVDSIKEINGIRTATIIGKDDAVRIFKDQFGEDIFRKIFHGLDCFQYNIPAQYNIPNQFPNISMTGNQIIINTLHFPNIKQ